MDPSELVHGTADAAFASGGDGKVLAWNQAAERLLGYKAAQVVGKPCHLIICGVDVFGNRWCDEKCNLRKITARRESVRRFELDVRRSTGQYVRVSVSVLTLSGEDPARSTIVHLLQPIEAASAAGPSAPKPASSPPRPNPLTRREVEVLRQLAAGAGTREIAERMFVSVATVRTHVQNILSKLDVHSKLAAVSVALRDRLI